MNYPFKDAGRSPDGDRARNPLPALWGRRLPGFGRPALQIALVLLVAAGVARGSGTNARTFLLSAPALTSARARLNQGDAQLQPAFAKLREDAEAALKLKSASVMNKPRTAVSGDKHDYFSYGPYWWPDPAKPDGVPYIRRDGERNPASLENTDDAAFSLLGPAIETLGLAYWFTGDERYAKKAALLARVWFLDPATRMSPNFQYAQAIPGITDGRGIGIIEARRLINVNEGLALIAGSPAWTEADRAAFRTWLTAFYEWLTTSANGRDEQAAENNHGTWYDAQVAHLALVLGRTPDAKRILTEGLALRLARQIEPDGSQPHELSRTKSLNYSIYNLEGLFVCARLAEHVGVDWWSFGTSDGRSLRAALAFLAPYLDASKPWPRKDIHPGDRDQILPLLAQYLRHRNLPELLDIYSRHAARSQLSARWRLVYGAPAGSLAASESMPAAEPFFRGTIAAAAKQYRWLLAHLPDEGKLPRSFVDGKLQMVASKDWTSGFFPGSLWYLYEATRDSSWRDAAMRHTALLEQEQTNTRTHDVGFILNCSYGNGYRLTQNPAYREILIRGARSLSTRFNPEVGLIRSWDHGSWKYPVIIDNMMNLELLTWSAREAAEPRLRDIALSHADKTVNNHFRPDNSTWHVVDYSPTNGEVLKRQTHQGVADESAWARGQAWGLYGYTMMYRETRKPAYLAQAEKVARFLMHHPRLPEDKIPYWDFDAPDIPNAPKDASAAAIMASALIELGGYAEPKLSRQCLALARQQLISLASPAYLANPGENGGFLLRHCVGNLPKNLEVNVPLNYADFYFLEGLLRYRDHQSRGQALSAAAVTAERSSTSRNGKE